MTLIKKLENQLFKKLENQEIQVATGTFIENRDSIIGEGDSDDDSVSEHN